MISEFISSLKVNVSEVSCKTLTSEDWTWNNLIQPWNKLYYVINGSGYITHHNRKFHLTPGNMYLIPAHNSVSSYCQRSITKYWVHFNAKAFAGLEVLNLLTTEFVYKVKNQQEFKFIFERLQAAFKGDHLGDKLEVEGTVRFLMAPFLSQITEDSLSHRIGDIVKFEKVLAYIEKNLSSPITLAELAEINHVSPQHFASQFKKHLKVSPIQYCNRCRIEKARDLLWGTNDSIFEIARKLGFEDVFYFSRIFKKISGVSPNTYRKQKSLV